MQLQFKTEFYTGGNYQQVIVDNATHNWAVYKIFDNAFLNGIVITYVRPTRYAKERKIKSLVQLSENFTAWADTLERNTRQLKLKLFNYWKQKDEEISAIMFTKWMRSYCLQKNINYISHKSNGIEYVTLAPSLQIDVSTAAIDAI